MNEIEVGIKQSNPYKCDRLFTGRYEERELGPDKLTLHVLYADDETLSLRLLGDINDNGSGRYLTSDECDTLYLNGVVRKMVCRHPRADRYGVPYPLSFHPAVQKAICGNMGFAVTPDFEFACVDRNDDGICEYLLTVEIPAAMVGLKPVALIDLPEETYNPNES